MKKKITIGRSQLNKIKDEAAKEAIDKVMLIFLLALHDEYGFGEKRLVRGLETADRYASHVDSKLVQLKEVQAIVEKNTGLKFKGW